MQPKFANLEFRKVPSLKYLYEISEDGRYVRNVKSKKYLTVKLDTHHSKVGYFMVWFCRKIDGKQKVFRRSIHSLVAECWHGAKPDGMEIDHIDRNPHNNHYSNLRYVTHSGQMKNRVLGDKVLNAAKTNCARWNASISVGVSLTEGGSTNTFASMGEASRYIADARGITAEQARYHLKKRRSHILGFDVTYRNAETVRQQP